MKDFVAYLINWERTDRDERDAVRMEDIKAASSLWARGAYDPYHLKSDSKDKVFETLNISQPADYKLRSMSSGDLVLDRSDDQLWLCTNFGWASLGYVLPERI